MIEERRGEGSEQSIVGNLDLDTVEARFDHVVRADAEAIDDSADVVVVERLGAEMTRRLGHLRRRPHDVGRVLQRGVAAVGELGENLGAVGVSPGCDFSETGDDRGVPGVENRADICQLRGSALGDDQTELRRARSA